MGIRCIVDKQGHCSNGHVRGMAWRKSHGSCDPTSRLGTRELAHYRDGGGVNKVTVRTLDGKGQVVVRTKIRRLLRTETTPTGAHLQPRAHVHRSRTSPSLSSSHWRSLLRLARTLGVDTTEVTTTRLTVNDPGRRPRTFDIPSKRATQKLCQAIP